MFRTILLSTLCLLPISSLATDNPPQTIQSNAVILQYHHVSADTPAITSVTPEQFESHLQLIEELNMVVLPVGDLISDIHAGRALADNAVAITFDDGYESIYTQAFPLLKKRNWPFTVFVNPLAIEERHGKQMSWAQLSEMKHHGATIVNHSHYHNHLLQKHEDESENTWLTRTMKDINLAQAWLEEKLDTKYKWLAYPYGEMNEALKTALLLDGYLGFSQQSGAINHTTDWQAIPRYPASGIYANLNTLRTKLQSLAFTVLNSAPSHELRYAGQNLPKFQLTVAEQDIARHTVQCFYNGSPIKTEVIKQDVDGTSALVISTQALDKLPLGRTRYNCTAKSKTKNRYYWHSIPFIATNEERQFVD